MWDMNELFMTLQLCPSPAAWKVYGKELEVEEDFLLKMADTKTSGDPWWLAAVQFTTPLPPCYQMGRGPRFKSRFQRWFHSFLSSLMFVQQNTLCQQYGRWGLQHHNQYGVWSHLQWGGADSFLCSSL